jgi:D-glycero-D-manno-heptose 1,7-bisphosphate phosphatase
MKVRGAILDRDGTIIDFHRDAELGAVVSAFHPSQIRLLPGALEGLRALQAAGFLLGIATNQPGPAKGQVPREAITRTNLALVEMLAAEGITIGAVAACMHHPEGGPGGDPELARACDCRKPAPGMLFEVCRELGVAPADAWMIGDSSADVQAARRAGTRAALVVDLRRCELCPLKGQEGPYGADVAAPRLDEVVRAILRVG